jgi:hypothetical protein
MTATPTPDGAPVDLAGRVAALERRVSALEDELAVHRTIVRYGFAVDTGEADSTAALFTEDCRFDVDGRVMEGPGDVRSMVLGAGHQRLLPNAAHCIGPAVVDVGADGDEAVAVGYSRIYHRQGDDIELFRLGFNRWELAKADGTWRIRRRTTRMIGSEEAQRVLRAGVPAPSGDVWNDV